MKKVIVLVVLAIVAGGFRRLRSRGHWVLSALGFAAADGLTLVAMFLLLAAIIQSRADDLFDTSDAAGTPAASAEMACRVADPTGTPLNVRSSPAGNIVGNLTNGTLVRIIDNSSVRGKTWAYVAGNEGQAQIGWVFRDYLDCAAEKEAKEPQAAQGESPATSMMWHFHNRSGYIAQVKLYSGTRKGWQWPSADRAWNLDDDAVHDLTISCQPREQICYGAWLTEDPETSWGQGPHSQYCEKCCYACGASTEIIPLDLTK